MNPESNGVKTWQWVVTVLVIIILIVLGYFLFRGGEAPSIDVGNGNGISTSTPIASGQDRVVVTDQFPGNIVYISSAQFANPGFVVIQKDNNGQPGAVIGSQYFDAGINPGRVTLTENTTEGGVYYAVLYADTNNNRVFDATIDQPLRNSAGNIIMQVFRSTASAPEIKA